MVQVLLRSIYRTDRAGSLQKATDRKQTTIKFFNRSHHVLITDEEANYPIRHHCWHLCQEVTIVTNNSYERQGEDKRCNLVSSRAKVKEKGTGFYYLTRHSIRWQSSTDTHEQCLFPTPLSLPPTCASNKWTQYTFITKCYMSTPSICVCGVTVLCKTVCDKKVPLKQVGPITSCTF